MTDDDLIRRVRARAEDEAPTLPVCASPQSLAEAEELLGFALPPLLARLYSEVAGGGFGPDYKLLPLIGEGRTAVTVYRTERTRSQTDPVPHWPHGVLPILDWGCAMYAAVDCLQPAAPVLLFEPNAIKDWPDAWFQDSPSLAGWLTAWLSGTRRSSSVAPNWASCSSSTRSNGRSASRRSYWAARSAVARRAASAATSGQRVRSERIVARSACPGARTVCHSGGRGSRSNSP
ncbi:SMI1/KNR4 family protein [Actinacidiphila oryziradicis]|uniref:SMI1/KNR4 family protein n=1 Tax=Actinacidiphila oryziradicis TaxID=2571141 RepID=A0A4U0T8P2_9ACTN|nr:SMI1/KNR4 family protein [Actinacidiphila oryziradicis]TKA11245.1 SMI1/KNR4 family protein [Actinacidiphila oryziradicis]